MENFGKKTFLILLAAIIFYAGILFFSDIQKIVFDLNKLKYEFYFPIIGITAINITLSGIRYHILIGRLGIKIQLKDSLLIYVAGLSMAITPGGSGGIIKSHIIKKKLGRSYSTTTPIILYEKWLELVSVLIVIGTLFIWVIFLESIIALGISVIFAIFFLVFLKKPKGLSFFNNFVQRIGPLRNFTIGIEEFKDSTKKLMSTKLSIGLTLLTLITKFNGIVIIYFIFRSFGLDIDFFTGGQIFYTSALIGILSFIPAGMVVTESSLLGMIIRIGIDFSLASILVIIIRFFTMWVGVIVGFITLKLVLNQNRLIKEK